METVAEIKQITKNYTYSEYKELVLKYADEQSTSGEQTIEHIKATEINAQRVKRIDKQCEINEELKNVVKKITKKYTWILITESWCGDGAQCIPVIAKIAELNSNINLKLIMRDENLSIMDKFLTNGSRSIPKLIFLEEENVIGTWGPRPKEIQKKVTEFKAANPNVSHEEFVTNIHLWYARDKTQAIQNEFIEILNNQL